MCLLDKEVTIKFGNGSRSGCGNFGNEILRLRGTREIQHILLITQEVVNKFVYNSLRTGCLSLVTIKPFDFAADTDRDLLHKFLTEYLP